MLHRRRLFQFLPQQPLADVRMTPQLRKSAPEVSAKQDDLYARAWEREYERSIFDADDDNTAPLIHQKLQYV